MAEDEAPTTNTKEAARFTYLDNFFAAWAKSERDREIDRLLRYLDNLDAKSAALLTHVSIMMATTLLLFYYEAGPTDNHCLGSLDSVIAVEAIGYMIIAIECIRSIWIIPPYREDKNQKDFIGRTKAAIITRYATYSRALVCALVLTAMLVLTFAAKISYGYWAAVIPVCETAVAAA